VTNAVEACGYDKTFIDNTRYPERFFDLPYLGIQVKMLPVKTLN